MKVLSVHFFWAVFARTFANKSVPILAVIRTLRAFTLFIGSMIHEYRNGTTWLYTGGN